MPKHNARELARSKYTDERLKQHARLLCKQDKPQAEFVKGDNNGNSTWQYQGQVIVIGN